MKKAIRLLSLALALFMLPIALIACNNDDGNKGITDIDPNSPIEEKNYGETFNYLVMDDIMPFEYMYATEKLYNEMNDSIYQRQLNVGRNIGVEITAKKTEDYNSYATDFETSISSQDNTYQLCLTHCNIGVATFATKGYLYDFADFESINLDASYWNKDLMDTVKFKGEYLLGYGDLCLASVYTVVFNKSLLATYGKATLGNDTIYDLVHDKKWTLDMMGTLASAAYEDLDGDGLEATDRYGLSGCMWVPACSFLQSCGANISRYNKDTKAYELCINTQRVQQIINKVQELYDAEYSFMHKSEDATDSSKMVQMKTGRTLFELQGSYNLVDLKSTNVKFGVLPYPTFTEGQEYRSLSWNGYMAVPYNIDVVSDPEMISDTLELLQYYSKPVTVAFYEKLLGAQVSDVPDDADMLDIIWDSQVSDFAMAYSNTTTSTKPLDALLYAIPRIILGIDQTNNLNGYWARHGKAATNDMKSLQDIK